jgi:plastocyanin
MDAEPDGNIWFTEGTAEQIGRVSVAAAGESYVLSLASGFAPVTRTVSQGKKLQWTFSGPTAQSVVDSSGMGLFDSGSLLPVSFFTFQFRSAGTYLYADPLNPGHKASIAVPIKAMPASGTETTTFTITWSQATASLGYVFDVQVLRPAAFWFEDWQTGVIARSATFTADAGPGVYWFRARLRKLGGGKSHWSPTAQIVVS